MEKVIEEYRNQIKYFLSNKIYLISIIIIGIIPTVNILKANNSFIERK